MAKALAPNFHQTEAILDPLQRSPEISDDVSQTLSRLMGWFDLDSVWKFIRTDSIGRLLVASGSGLASTINVTNFALAVGVTRVLQANPARLKFEILNNSQANLFIEFNPDPSGANAIFVAPGELYYDDVYSGDVFALVFVAMNTQVREWV